MADATDERHPDPGEALRTAASAAIAGAAVGAARALARRRQSGADDDHEPQSDASELDGDEDLDEPDDEPAAMKPEQEPDQPRGRTEPEPARPRDGAPPAEARRIVNRAREQLRQLRGVEAESVSSVRRTADGWHVGLEVVELHRIPESTDVLATYEVELDEDGGLITFERTGRYHRSAGERR